MGLLWLILGAGGVRLAIILVYLCLLYVIYTAANYPIWHVYPQNRPILHTKYTINTSKMDPKKDDTPYLHYIYTHI
jgi:hypothetical protein